MSIRVAILDDYQDSVQTLNCFAQMSAFDTTVFTDIPPDKEALIERLREFDAVVLIRERTYLTAEILNALPRLKAISQTGKAGRHIDLEACQRLGITVLEGRGSPVAPAELTWTLMLCAMRQLPSYIHNLKQGIWQESGLGIGRCMAGKQLGIWGYGKIGQTIARYAQAFDMNVLVWGSPESRAGAQDAGHSIAESKEALFESADILSLHLRLSERTQGVVTEADLKLMKPEALLVNASRAELIEPGALVSALKSGRPGFAALDVFEQEPLSASDPLLSMPNVVATPHIGFVERDGYELYFGDAFTNLREHFKLN